MTENPSSDDRSTGLPLFDVLGIGFSLLVSFAIDVGYSICGDIADVLHPQA